MNLLERIILARQKFIRFYERGKSDPEYWARSMSTYLYWAVESYEFDRIDDDVLEIIGRAGSISPSFSTIDEVMARFDVAERLAKICVFL